MTHAAEGSQVQRARALLAELEHRQHEASWRADVLNLALSCHGRMLELGDTDRPAAVELAIAGADLLQALANLSGPDNPPPDWQAVHEEQCCRYGAIWIHAQQQQGSSLPAGQAQQGLRLLGRLEQLHPSPIPWIGQLRSDLQNHCQRQAAINSQDQRIVVVGNCQAHPLMLGLRQALPAAEIHFCPSVHLATEADVARLHRRLPSADLLVMHRIQPGYRHGIGLDCTTLRALLPAHGRSVVLPNLHYEGLYPWIGYAQDPDGRFSTLESESPLGPYHDFLAMVAARDDLPPDLLLRTDAPAALLETLRQHHRQSLAELQLREADCDLALSDWLECSHRRLPVAHTINHPTQAALDQLLRRLLQHLRLSHHLGDQLFDATEHLGLLSIPVHPWVRQALTLETWANSWGQRQGTPLTIEQQLEESVAFYRRHPWIAAANANHTKLLLATTLLQQAVDQSLPASSPSPAPQPRQRARPSVAALINYFNDVDMLAWQLRSGCLSAYDRIYIWDGPYGYLHQLPLFPDEAHRLDTTALWQELLADPRVVYRYRHWNDEAEKRIDGYAAVEEDLVVLHDTDEFFHLDPERLQRFWTSPYAVGAQRLQNLYAGGLRGSDDHHSGAALDALPLRRLLFRRQVIRPERHLDYLWVVGVQQQPADSSVVDPEPLGHNYHLTCCRTARGQAAKMAFYMSLSLAGQGSHPVVERLNALVQVGQITLPEAQAVFLRGDPGFAGVPHPAFSLNLSKRLHHPDFPPELLDAMVAETNKVAAGRYTLLAHYPLQLWIPAGESAQRLVLQQEQPLLLRLESWLWRSGERAALEIDLHITGNALNLALPADPQVLGRLLVVTLTDHTPAADLHTLEVGLTN